MEREDIFDKEFCDKLKAFYSFDEGNRSGLNIGYRRTGRTHKLAKILLETAIESRREIEIVDHYLDIRGSRESHHYMQRAIEYAAHEYRQQGVEIDLRFNNRGESFSAYLVGGGMYYEKLRNNPFPIKLIEQRKEFLQKQLLLLL